MKNKHKNIILTITVGVFVALATTAQAETKIATIELRKIFDNYYKTKLADAALKAEADAMDKEDRAMIDNYKKAVDAYKQLLDQVNDQSLSAEEHAKAQKTAAQKLSELKDTEQTIAEYERSSSARINEKKRIKRDDLLKDIRDTIDKKAKASGFSMVIDTSGESVNGAPLVLYTNGENDITADILAQLNATAPASATPSTNAIPAGK